MENENKKGKKIFFTVLKVIFFIVYVLVTAYLAFSFVSAVTAPENSNIELALFLVFGVIIVGGIGYIVSIIPGLIGLLTAIFTKSKKGDIVFFIVAVILPIITEGAFILICKILSL